MGALDDLARTLSDPKRIGLDDDLAKELRLADESLTKTRLEAQLEDGKSFRTVHLLAAWVEDDTDIIGKGEVYWWAIPMLGNASGKVLWSPLCGLPTGVPPESVGSKSWMKGFDLAKPPMLVAIPPSEDYAAAFVHIGMFDDDWAPAKLAPAMKAGLSALASVKGALESSEAFSAPIRKAIFDSLKAQQDDLMLERTIKLLREEGKGYGAGAIGSALTEFVRIYWIVKDLDRTETLGPWSLAKGQEQRVLPPSGLEGNGLLSIFARGGPVRAEPFGTLDTERPFINAAIDSRHESALAGGFTIVAEGDADVVAFYTPPG